MRNRMYGSVRGRKTKVGRKLLRFPPTRLRVPVKLSNPFELAITKAHIRPHFDNSHNLHPYGDVNRSGSCSSFHES